MDYDTDSDLPDVMWHKFRMMKRIIDQGQHDWIWWIDFDTLITNGNITLQDIIQEALADVFDPTEIYLLLNLDW